MEGGYVIAETGMLLAGISAEILSAEFGLSREKVGLGTPGEDSGCSLCIFPYDVRKNTDVQAVLPVAEGVGRLRNPPQFYDVYYMLVPYSDGDLKYRTEEELKLADALLAGLGDVCFLESERHTEFCLCNPDFDEKAKIWNALNQPLRPAVYCKAGPVAVISGRTRAVNRVSGVWMHFDEKDGTGRR